MIDYSFPRIQKWFHKRTEKQKGDLWFVVSLITYFMIYLLIGKNPFSFLSVIPALCFIKAGLYWWIDSSQRKLRPLFKKILLILFVLWLILLSIELILRFTRLV